MTITRWVLSVAAVFASLVLIPFPALFAQSASTPLRSTDGAPAPKRLAVLPFENQGAAEDDYFADGITDEVRGKLSAIPGLEIIAGESSNPYRRTAKTPQQIGRELGVRYFLTATVRRETESGGATTVHISPELIEITGDAEPTSRWRKQFDEALTNVFAVEADIASHVASALNVPLSAAVQAQLTERPTQNLAAYDAYLRAIVAFDNELAAVMAGTIDPAVMRRMPILSERAVALDSSFAAAWAQLAWADVLAYFSGVTDSAVLRRARGAADHAVSLGPNNAQAQVSLAEVAGIQGDTAPARRAIADALQLAPNDAGVLSQAAYRLVTDGRFEEAAPIAKHLATLDPRSEDRFERRSYVLLYMRRPVEALEAVAQARRLAPKSLLELEREIMGQIARGDLPAARGVLARATDFDRSELLAYVAYYGDMYWVLDDAQQQAVLGLTQSAFRNDPAAWANTRAQLFALREDTVRMRAYADTAQIALENQLRDAPGDADRRVIRALMLAYLGRKDEAEQQAAMAGQAAPVSADVRLGPYVLHQQIRIHLALGETDKALSELEQLLETPYWVTKAWLRIDPTFATLKGNPRFERLAGK